MVCLADTIECEVMRMNQKLIPLALCVGVLLLGREYYKAIRHEFYQVWDSMDELKAKKSNEAKSKGEKNEVTEQSL